MMWLRRLRNPIRTRSVRQLSGGNAPTIATALWRSQWPQPQCRLVRLTPVMEDISNSSARFISRNRPVFLLIETLKHRTNPMRIKPHYRKKFNGYFREDDKEHPTRGFKFVCSNADDEEMRNLIIDSL